MLRSLLPQCWCESNGTIYVEQRLEMSGEVPRHMWECNNESHEEGKARNSYCSILLFLLELSLLLPRRLTIPMVEETCWPKVFAIASVVLALVLLDFLWNSQ